MNLLIIDEHHYLHQQTAFVEFLEQIQIRSQKNHLDKLENRFYLLISDLQNKYSYKSHNLYLNNLNMRQNLKNKSRTSESPYILNKILFNSDLNPFFGLQFFFFKIISYLQKIYKLIQNYKISDIITVSRFSYLTLITVFLGKILHKRIIHYENIVSTPSLDNFWNQQFIKFWERYISPYILNNAHSIITPSTPTLKLLSKKFNIAIDKFSLFSYWSHIQPTKNTYKEKFTDKNIFNIYYHHTDHCNSNIEIILNMAKNLNYKVTNFNIYISGEESIKEYIYEQIKNTHLENKIIFLGKLNELEQNEILNKSDIFVSLPPLDIFDNKLIEAILTTNICLAPNTVNNQDIIHCPICLIDKDKLNADYLSDKIIHLIGNIELVLPYFQADKNYRSQTFTYNNFIFQIQEFISKFELKFQLND
jgi:Glycosyl transferases group 1